MLPSAPVLLDERTLLLVSAVASLVTASVFASLVRSSRVEGLRWWSAGYFTVSVTFLSILVPIPDWRIESLLFNVPIAWGHILILIGTLHFLGRRVPWKIVGFLPWLPLAVTVWFTFVSPRADLRVGILAALDVIVVAWTALEFLRSAAPIDRRGYQVTGAVLLTQALGTLAQSVVGLSAGAGARYGLPDSPLANIAAWAPVLLATIVCSQTLLLLVARRLIGALRDAAHHDPLTGCLNRRGLREALEGPLAAAIAARASAVVLMMDVDRFKAVNDRHGHAIGDRVLEVLGGVLRERADEGVHIARWGGEEFVVVMLGASIEDGIGRAQTVRHQFATATAALPELSAGCTLSVGLAARALGDGVGLTDPREAADAALYEAKRRAAIGSRCSR